MPGKMGLESLMLTVRLYIDSKRSPKRPTTTSRAETAAALGSVRSGAAGPEEWKTPSGPHLYFAARSASPMPMAMPVAMPPASPSQDFFGEMRGNILWRPQAVPTAKAPVSLILMTIAMKKVRKTPARVVSNCAVESHCARRTK